MMKQVFVPDCLFGSSNQYLRQSWTVINDVRLSV